MYTIRKTSSTDINVKQSETGRIWSVAEAGARLNEILRLAEFEGPQHVHEEDGKGGVAGFVIVSSDVWHEKVGGNPDQSHINGPADKHLGQWLLENAPRAKGVKAPKYDEQGRYIAFSDVVFDE